ncbi:hypothetical protein L798_04912 [Zootermopsis nevadensis]|uniref:Uncharacterized protein n=1 Tax=Zootermopsis nevadensis TaxID=136037 RepID=A0A067QHG1_ZOONE|nr:hypothetical protein L798_04912 [Zootermopsis nevadensis]
MGIVIVHLRQRAVTFLCQHASPDDSSSVSIYENFENSLRDSIVSDTDFEGSIDETGGRDGDIAAIVIQE